VVSLDVCTFCILTRGCSSGGEEGYGRGGKGQADQADQADQLTGLNSKGSADLNGTAVFCVTK